MAYLAGLHSLAVALRILSPALYNPAVGRKELASIAILNAFTLAVACWYAAVPLHDTDVSSQPPLRSVTPKAVPQLSFNFQQPSQDR